MRKIRYPYVGIRDPQTGETVMVKEHRDDDEGWTWLYRGRTYNNLEEVLEVRGKKNTK